MNCWCRLCRKWVYEEHFRDPKTGRRDHCGQGRDDIRFHPGRALCGDVWKMRDGRHMLIDFVDSFATGVTFSDGEQRGCKYTGTIEDMLRREEAELVSTFEERHFPAADARGWTPAGAKATDWSKEESVRFIQYVLDSVAGKFAPATTPPSEPSE